MKKRVWGSWTFFDRSDEGTGSRRIVEEGRLSRDGITAYLIVRADGESVLDIGDGKIQQRQIFERRDFAVNAAADFISRRQKWKPGDNYW